ncbi:importin subunit alpha-3-like [Vigna radiata var. radiata]|uniref:Importin subunit alpha-3-like n=1 Tax=Vigna radiata var. radiata TaxID=3916 RepID=A0A3Q0EUG6_VIGRR|nr:importin subunit alpha-3-like [Vigna radiata var. radiata]
MLVRNGLILVRYPSDRVILPALEALGNIAAAGEAHTQFLIDNQLLPCLRQLLTREYTKTIFKEASWTIAVITSWTGAQVQAVIDANIIPALVKIVHNAEFEVKKEAACAIYNVTCIGSEDNIRFLAAEGCIEALCELLTCPEPKLLGICLGCLVIILAVGNADKDEKGNVFAQRLEECGGLDKVETLQLHENNDIHKRALCISDFFRAEN